MKIVQFVEDSPPYTVGEEAGFDDKMAAKLVTRGAARYVAATEEPAQPATPVIAPDTTAGAFVATSAAPTPVVSTIASTGEEAPAAPPPVPATEQTPASEQTSDASGTATSSEGGAETESTVDSGADAGSSTLDALTDDQLRDLIEKRDGRRPNARASRETLLAKAKADPAASPAGDSGTSDQSNDASGAGAE